MIEAITQSMINMFERCSEQFRRRYIEDEITPPGIAARIGTGLHKGAEVNHRAKLVTGQDEPLSVVQDAARDEYVRKVQEGVFFSVDEVSTARKKVAEGVDTTVRLAKLYRESLAPTVQPKLVEQRIEIEVSGLAIPLAGTVDLVTVENNWHDIKSADKKWPDGRADKELQPTLYRELVHGLVGEYPSHLFFDIFTKSKMEHHHIETTRTDADFQILVNHVQIMLKMIAAGIFPPAKPDSWWCNRSWCGYWWSCSYIPNHRKVMPK
jgi:hypothetical protein